MFEKTAIYGLGQFGFALSLHLAKKYSNDQNITIQAYDVDSTVRSSIQSQRTQPYHFPGTTLPEKVKVTDSIESLLHGACLLVLAIPAQTIRSNLKKIKLYLAKETAILNVAKALEDSTSLPISKVIEQELNPKHACKIAAMGGGMIAGEMIKGIPLGADIACTDITLADKLRDFLSGESLRLYSTDDLHGVEYASAMKNVFSIGAGILDGLGYPISTKSFYITRAANEGAMLGIEIGAKPSTFSKNTQCWYGDLILSCIGSTRNRQLGEYIGKGMHPSKALETLASEHKIAEGYVTAKVLHNLAVQKCLGLPIISQIYQVLYESKTPCDCVKELMCRPPKRID